ncbi:zinc-ribbon domain-containing protein [Glaciihabitans sp. dw_435]|uniref:zinc-ribbon domain-containing protein n=1 Tax=Glaciihabitans sp. dw_435 TaxID=2720081 RepID=UPI001BD3D0A8|nr:zinc-ribbon domain-containing protein [Glaciihabitans sp. dw_435]
MTCTSCGAELPAGAMFCGECGRSVSARDAAAAAPRCEQCNAVLGKADIFCGVCGFVVRSALTMPGPRDTVALNRDELIAGFASLDEQHVTPVSTSSVPVVTPRADPAPVRVPTPEPTPGPTNAPTNALTSAPSASAARPVPSPPPGAIRRGVQLPPASPAPIVSEPVSAVPPFSTAVPAADSAVPVAPPVSAVPPISTAPPVSAAPPISTASPAPSTSPAPRPASPAQPPAAVSDLDLDDLDVDDLEKTRIVRRSDRGERFVLQFSTGESFTVYGSGLLGRNPRPQPSEFFDNLIVISDPGKSVSKTHLEFGQEAGAFWVCDRFSGNGSVAREPEQQARRLDAGKRYRIARGTRIDIGEQFLIVS